MDKSPKAPRQDVPASHDTLISGDYKILTGMVGQAGWTGPQYPNQTNPAGGIKVIVNCTLLKKRCSCSTFRGACSDVYI